MPVIFYFSTTIKFIFFLFFIRFIFFTFFSYFFFLKTLFLIIALGSTLFGVLGSLFQNKLKLFIAYSGVSHIGLVFFSLSVFNFMGVFSALFYLFFYILASILFFGFILNINIVNYNKT
jgi:NADH-quinone oxidoreductase subunit N